MTVNELISELKKHDGAKLVAVFSTDDAEGGNIQCHLIDAVHDIFQFRGDSDTSGLDIRRDKEVVLRNDTLTIIDVT